MSYSLNMRAESTQIVAEKVAISWCFWQSKSEYGKHNGMTDTVSSVDRSKIMSRVRSKCSKAEVMLRKALHARGFRYRVNRRGLPGTPDLVFPRRGAVLFVHGCFWHRHDGCRRATTPATNEAFWTEKFKRNIERDARKIAELEALSWRVGVVWECEVLRQPLGPLLDRIAVFLTDPEGVLKPSDRDHS